MRRFLLVLVLVLTAIGLLAWNFSEIFSYFLLAVVVTALLRPLVSLVQQITIYGVHIHRGIAILLAYTALFGFIGIFVLLFIPLISEQINVISNLRLETLYIQISRPLILLEEFLINNFLPDQKVGFLSETLVSNVIEFVRDINFQKLINSLLSVTGNLFISLLAIGFISFFLLYENGIVRRQLILLVPNMYFEVFIAALLKIERLLTNYLLGILIQMLSIFSIASLGLSLAGVNYALTIALFAAFANLIPYLGPLIGTTFGIVVGFSTVGNFVLDQESLILSLKIISVFAVVQITDNVFLQPLIFSRSVKAHPLEIFVIIFAGASLAGIPGMIAAIPVYTIFRVSGVEIKKGLDSYRVFQSN